ncbi:hypothetical protein FNH05_19000 [Amycolatopsis rhizosphaerae]|uniref:Uncharacterized protein n=1 Tax=Amycolatopsis rhizosphaerae TaxID=2053003 RepID=A0A558CFU4_9PSEU|nr:hypothetical protein [Amycolatopsis rhizosphaerae]TVT47512.1 hypothetical protein FNH05_19000 [Amycolatopsis rhizosphaerae]
MKFRARRLAPLGLVPMAAMAIGMGAPAMPALAQGQAGTTLTQDVTATPHWTNTYHWTIQKSATPTTVNLTPGQSAPVNYTINLARDNGTEEAYITGAVCITNGGAVATENLASTLTVTQPPMTTPIATQPLDVSGHPVLAAGETHCYQYRVNVPIPPDAGHAYKVTADTTITNHSGHLGVPFGPSTSASFDWPLSITPVHSEVRLTDSFAGYLGTFSSSQSVPYTRTFTCADAGIQTNTASLTYTDDNTPGPSASASVQVNCSSKGCTYTIGYWATHEQATTALLPITLGTENGQKSITVDTWAEASYIFPPSFSGNASNGINRLYAQLLAAKLNIANGASDTAVAGTIAAADAFLATHNSADWGSLNVAERGMVNSWATTLDRYNNGIIGPGHCNELPGGTPGGTC